MLEFLLGTEDRAKIKEIYRRATQDSSVGKSVFIYEEIVRLQALFKTLDYDFTYRESEGSHDWEFWDEYILRSLHWMLGIN